MGLVLISLIVVSVYNAIYCVYAVKRSDGGDVCYALLLITMLLVTLWMITGLLRTRG